MASSSILNVVMLLGFMVLASESCGNVQTGPATSTGTVLITVTGNATQTSEAAYLEALDTEGKSMYTSILEGAYKHYDSTNHVMKYLLEGTSCATGKKIALSFDLHKVMDAVAKC